MKWQQYDSCGEIFSQTSTKVLFRDAPLATICVAYDPMANVIMNLNCLKNAPKRMRRGTIFS